jgi:uncharacterized protein YqeY
MSLKARIQDDVKNAMRAHQREQLAALRLLTAAIKQKEVDERIELTDEQVLAVLDKMVKQRRESLEQFEQAGRDDLAAKEQFELDLLQTGPGTRRHEGRQPGGQVTTCFLKRPVMSGAPEWGA